MNTSSFKSPFKKAFLTSNCYNFHPKFVAKDISTLTVVIFAIGAKVSKIINPIGLGIALSH